jgi:TPR repeat protein
VLSLEGIGCTKDLVRVVDFYTRFAEQGHLAVCLTSGIGIAVDLPSAAELSKKAADQGDTEAQFNYAEPRKGGGIL